MRFTVQPFSALSGGARYADAINDSGEIEAFINPCSLFARDRELVVGLGSERSLPIRPEYLHILDGRWDSHSR